MAEVLAESACDSRVPSCSAQRPDDRVVLAATSRSVTRNRLRFLLRVNSWALSVSLREGRTMNADDARTRFGTDVDE
jgi:hypothetical protein